MSIFIGYYINLSNFYLDILPDCFINSLVYYFLQSFY